MYGFPVRWSLLFFLSFLLFFPFHSSLASEELPSEVLASLVDPLKIDALDGKRAANPRLRKMVYWIEVARLAGEDPEEVVQAAQKLAGYAGTIRADADRASLVRNRIILERLGCLDESGMEKLRRGNAPTITKGPYAGDIASVDHIIPRSIVEELDEKIYNLELMPSKLNMGKGNKIGVRQVQLAEKWHRVGLLSESGLKRVREAFPGR